MNQEKHILDYSHEMKSLRGVFGMEIENCVEVKISGPKDQMNHYLEWIKQSAEYRYGTGGHQSKENLDYYLTESVNENSCWKFSSSNLKHKVRLFERGKKEVFKYRVNYLINYSNDELTDEAWFQLNEMDHEQAMFQDLVNHFNPMPTCIAKLCPDLKVSIKWDSYYIEHQYGSKYDEDMI